MRGGENSTETRRTMKDNFKSGFVTIIGRPNVGKSTLMNHLIGQKIAITSKKPQTTRNRIQTVYTCEEGQIVFLDTPGIHKAKNKLGEYMVNVAEHTLKEVDVILDEINSYEDSPSELIFDEFENLLYDGHALGHNILGDEASLLSFNSESGRSFMRRFYAPENMVFFSMGRVDFKKIVKLAESLLSDIAFPIASRNRVAPAEILPCVKKVHKDTHQAHVLIGSRAYSMHDEKRIPLFLLNNMLGGPGMNNRLNVSLREKHGLVYNVESNVTSYTDTGLASIYFGTDPKNMEKALKLVHKELGKIRDVKLSATQLAAAKKQVIGQLGVSGDNKEGLFLGLGKSFLHYNRYDTLPEVFSKVESLTAEEIQEVANEVFAPERLFSLIYQ